MLGLGLGTGSKVRTKDSLFPGAVIQLDCALPGSAESGTWKDLKGATDFTVTSATLNNAGQSNAYYSLAGSGKFVAGTNVPVLANLHKTSSGNQWTMVLTGETTGQDNDWMFGTIYSGTLQNGIAMRYNGNTTLNLQQYTGGSAYTVSNFATLPNSTQFIMILSYDKDSSTLRCWINDWIPVYEGAVSFNSNTNNPDGLFTLGGYGNTPEFQGKLYSFMMLDKFCSDEMAVDIIRYYNNTHPRTYVSTNAPAAKKLMIVSFGESNSGGYADNAHAMTYEISPRREIRWWDVTNARFADMDLASNNNIDHAGLNSASHGWELGLLSLKYRGYFDAYGYLYYVQTGQGGSKVADWDQDADAYWVKFLSRTAAAKAKQPDAELCVWMTLGINDAIDGTDANTFKTKMEGIITRIKAQLPGAKIFLTELPPVNGTYNSFTTKIQEIAAADADVYNIPTSNLDMRDTNHYSYQGMKQLAYRIVQQMGTDYDMRYPETPMTWSNYQSDNRIKFTATDQMAYVTETLNVANFESLTYLAGTASSALVIVLDDDVTATTWGSVTNDDYLLGMYYFYNTGTSARTADATVSNGSVVAEAGSMGVALWERIRKSGNDLIMDYSNDLGQSWTTLHTASGVLSGKTTFRIKAMQAMNSAEAEIWLRMSS